MKELKIISKKIGWKEYEITAENLKGKFMIKRAHYGWNLFDITNDGESTNDNFIDQYATKKFALKIALQIIINGIPESERVNFYLKKSW